MSVDQKRAFNKLKHDLEPWRNVITILDSLFVWEKNFYPVIIAAAISVFYLILWFLDMSTISMLAIAAIFALAVDFVNPSISRFFNSENWSGAQEEQFERVCNQLCTIKITLGGWYGYLFTTKERKSTLFVMGLSVSLLSVAWIGAMINNLLLMYLVTIGMAMYPGIQAKKVFKNFACIINSKISQVREKTKKTE